MITIVSYPRMLGSKGQVIALSYVTVRSLDSSWTFVGGTPRQNYEEATRFVRLLDRGFAESPAYLIANLYSDFREIYQSEFPNIYGSWEESCDLWPTSEVVKPKRLILSPAEVETLSNLFERCGEPSFVAHCERRMLDVSDTLNAVRCFIQSRDEEAQNWVGRHYEGCIQY